MSVKYRTELFILNGRNNTTDSVLMLNYFWLSFVIKNKVNGKIYIYIYI